MRLICIAVLHNKDRIRDGYRILDVHSGKTLDVKEEELINQLTNNNVRIENLEVGYTNIYIKSLIGTTGSLDRYPKLFNGIKNKANPPLIIVATIENKGYVVSDFTGKMESITKEEAYYYARHFGIANYKAYNNKSHTLKYLGENEYYIKYTDEMRILFERRSEQIARANSKIKMMGLPYKITPDFSIELTKNSKDIEELYLIAPIDKLDISIFDNLSRLRKLRYPHTLKIIQANSHHYSNSLSEVDIEDGLLFIGQSAFRDANYLNKLKLPKTLKVIGKHAFEWCRSLANVDLPESLELIEERAFQYSGLVNLRVPGNIKEINYGTFKNCESLTTLELCEGIEVLHEMSFAWCTNLTHVKLPSTIKYIHPNAFKFCDNINKDHLKNILKYSK